MTDAPPSTRRISEPGQSFATVAIASITSRTWKAIDSTTARARWARPTPLGQADDRSACVGIPPRASETGECRNDENALGVGNRFCERADLCGISDRSRARLSTTGSPRRVTKTEPSSA